MTLLIEDWIDNLIEEVQKRPALYVKDLKEYTDSYLKKKLWEEVSASVVPNWTTLTREEKLRKGHEVVKRWQNLRTCFARELKLQRRTKPGLGKRRRRYIYYDKLRFLLSSMQPRLKESTSEVAENVSDSGDYEPENQNVVDERNSPVPPPARKKRTEAIDANIEERTIPAIPQFKKRRIEEVKYVRSHKEQDDSHDRHFALSLVPLLNELSENEKLDAKIQILQVFKRIRTNRVEASCPTTPNYPATSSLVCHSMNQCSTNVLEYVKSESPGEEDTALSLISSLSAHSPTSDLYDLKEELN